MNAIVIPADLEPAPIEIEPRDCALCGLTIDRHAMVDHGEGPEFLCVDLPPDEMTLDELERRAELRRQEDVAAIIARWETMDEEIACRKATPPAAPAPYRTPQSTIDAFLHIAHSHDADYVANWLANHPQDIATLTKLWGEKNGLS